MYCFLYIEVECKGGLHNLKKFFRTQILQYSICAEHITNWFKCFLRQMAFDDTSCRTLAAETLANARIYSRIALLGRYHWKFSTFTTLQTDKESGPFHIAEGGRRLSRNCKKGVQKEVMDWNTIEYGKEMDGWYRENWLKWKTMKGVWRS